MFNVSYIISLYALIFSLLRIFVVFNLLVPVNGTMTGKCVFTAIVDAWNKLPFSVRNTASYLDFKKKLKTLLFKLSYDS